MTSQSGSTDRLQPATAVLAGAWTTANSGSIWLNGVNLGNIGPTAHTTTAFNLTSGFNFGINS